MIDLRQSVFSDLTFPDDCGVSVEKNTLYITKWNWEFEECLDFQKKAQKLIQSNRSYRIYIFCNHPHCFTIGRGNERGNQDLVDFDSRLVDSLEYPLYRVHRGGGITFHYPGQWIFYPIIAINEKYTLENHMNWLLNSVKITIRDYFGVQKVLATHKLMGVWFERKKLASIGVGLERFVTEHGIAVNLIYDYKMFSELTKINPCGMSSTVYTSIDNIASLKRPGSVREFHLAMLNLI